MIWNPWREIRRLRKELADERAEVEWQRLRAEQLARHADAMASAHLDAARKVAFLTARQGIDPQMLQVDDAGVVRLGLPPEAETRGTA